MALLLYLKKHVHDDAEGTVMTFFGHIHTTKATAPKGNRFPAHPHIIHSLHLQDLNERHDTSPYQQNTSLFVIHLSEELVCLNNAEVNIMVLNNSR